MLSDLAVNLLLLLSAPPLPPFVHVDLANCHAILILGSCNRIKNLVYEK